MSVLSCQWYYNNLKQKDQEIFYKVMKGQEVEFLKIRKNPALAILSG